MTDFQENMEALKHNFLLSGYFKNRGYEDSAELATNRIERVAASHSDKAVYLFGEGALRRQRFGQAEEPEISHRRRSVSRRRINSALPSSWFRRAWKATRKKTGSDGSSGNGNSQVPGGEFWIR